MHPDPCNPARAVNKSSHGPLVQANSDNGIAIFTGYDLIPGESCSAWVRIANAGSVAARFRLEEAEATNDLGTELILTIEDVSAGRALVYSGMVGDLPAGGLDLGIFEPGEDRAYRFAVYLDACAARAVRGGAGALYAWVPEGVPSA